MHGSRDVKINLLSYKFEEQRYNRQRTKEYAVLGLVILLLAGTALGITLQQQNLLKMIKADNQILQKEMESLQQVEAMAQVNHEKLAGIDSRRALVARLEKEPKLDPAFLEDLYIASQPDIIIGKMIVKNGELDINAYADTQTKFIDFLERLKNNPQITDIRNITSKLNEKNGEVNFSLTLEWEVQ